MPTDDPDVEPVPTESWSGPVDLDNCAQEPIHLSGAIQPHGVLLATGPSGEVVVSSANLVEWFGVDHTAAIGRPLAEVVDPAVLDGVAAARAARWQERYEVELTDGRTVSLHLSQGLTVLEVERSAQVHPPSNVVRDVAMSLTRALDVMDAAAEVATSVRALTGFDRVMVYRFDEEWNGEVIAEAKAEQLEPFFGLHYPSTDIPAQARELYRLNWLRLIPDIGYEPVPLHPPVTHDSAAPLDLSHAGLRSVSPIHIEYLQNMGVGASMSLSLIAGGELWGLIACHHYSGSHCPSVAVRAVSEHIAQLASVRLVELQTREVETRAAELAVVNQRIAETVSGEHDSSLAQVVEVLGGELLKVADATAAVVIDGSRRHRVGPALPDGVVDEVLAAWSDRTTPFVSEQPPGPATAAADGVCGVLAIAFSLTDAIVWFRPEYVHTVDWGGDPRNAKLAEIEGDSVRLSPRKSFELWRETVAGHSRPWRPVEVEAARNTARVFAAALARRDRTMSEFAADLQRALLPAELPALPAVALDAYSAPDGRGLAGGDWYDAFLTDPKHLAVVVGDIAGHGRAAASAMAQLRNALRAYLVDDPTPERALDRLNRLCDALLPDDMATVVVGLLDLETRELVLAGAGHPDPLLLRNGTSEFLVAGRNNVLGLVRDDFASRTHQLQRGDVLVFYSDGLVESRDRALEDRFAELAATARAEFAEGADNLSERLVGAMTPENRPDDVTVLTVHLRNG